MCIFFNEFVEAGCFGFFFVECIYFSTYVAIANVVQHESTYENA